MRLAYKVHSNIFYFKFLRTNKAWLSMIQKSFVLSLVSFICFQIVNAQNFSSRHANYKSALLANPTTNTNSQILASESVAHQGSTVVANLDNSEMTGRTTYKNHPILPHCYSNYNATTCSNNFIGEGSMMLTAHKRYIYSAELIWEKDLELAQGMQKIQKPVAYVPQGINQFQEDKIIK